MRIAPKASRLTVRSPPNWKVEFVAIVGAVDEAAPKITSDPAKSAAPLARVVPRNLRRVTPGFSLYPRESFILTSNYVHINGCQRERALLRPSLPRCEPSVTQLLSLRSHIRTANASSRSFPKATMPPSCPAMTRIFLFCTSVTLKRRLTSDAISGVP